MRAMPKTLDLFKRHGVNFNHGYVTTPLCCPARASMYSGLYAHNHGIITNNPQKQFGTTYLWQDTFPAKLQGAGYHTGLFGKYLNNWDKARRARRASTSSRTTTRAPSTTGPSAAGPI